MSALDALRNKQKAAKAQINRVKYRAKRSIKSAPENVKANLENNAFIKNSKHILESDNKLDAMRGLAATKLKSSRLADGGRWLISHAKIIKIAAIAIIISCLAIRACGTAVSYMMSFRSSPHYYCDIDASADVKNSALYKQYCSTSAHDNSSLALAAINLAICDTTIGGKTVEYTCDGLSDVVSVYGDSSRPYAEDFVKIATEICNAMGKNANYQLQASCDWTVMLAVRWSGADDNYPTILGGNDWNTPGSGRGQGGYLENNISGNWKRLSEGESIQAGDIAIVEHAGGNGGADHVYMFIADWDAASGEWDCSYAQERFPGSTATVYEGSFHQYYAQLDHAANGSPWDNNEKQTRIYRYVGDYSGETYINILP